MNCAKCGHELPAHVGAGRPRKFCGDVCKRAATMEIRRLDSRIAKLERDESTWRVRGATTFAAGAAAEIKRLEARMAALIAAGSEEVVSDEST